MDPAAPDWINQVRRIPSKHAREDIVINRDEDEGQNEKGPVAKMVSLQSRLERGDVMGGESQISETAAASGSGSSRSPAGTANAHDGEAEEDVTLTDLGEGKHQWREGRDLIVEYQSHESDEVRSVIRMLKPRVPDVVVTDKNLDDSLCEGGSQGL